jgi:hypothetical protein
LYSLVHDQYKCEEPVTFKRSQKAEVRRPELEDRRRKAEAKKLRIQFLLQASFFRLLSSDFCLPSSVFCLPSSVFRLLSSVFCLPSSVFRLPASHFFPFCIHISSISSSDFPVVSGNNFHTISMYGMHIRANNQNVPAGVNVVSIKGVS